MCFSLLCFEHLTVFALTEDPEKSRRVCQCDPCKMKKQKLKSKEPINRLKRRAM